MQRRVRVVLTLLPLAALAVGCQVLGRLDDYSIGVDGDAAFDADAGDAADVSADGSLDGEPADAPAEADTGALQPVADACKDPSHSIYVATDGDDANVGTDCAQPLRTIAQALARARLPTFAAYQEIHVAIGRYDEHGLVLDRPVRLLGGFQAASPGAWMKTAAFDAYNFAPSSGPATELSGASPVTVRFTGGATAGTLLHGFVVRPPTSGRGGVGIDVETGSAARIEETRVEATSTFDASATGPVQTVAVRIARGAPASLYRVHAQAPDVTNVGGLECPATPNPEEASAIGLALEVDGSAAPSVTDSRFKAGKADTSCPAERWGVVGALVGARTGARLSGSAALARLDVTVGHGASTTSYAGPMTIPPSVGLLIDGDADAEVALTQSFVGLTMASAGASPVAPRTVIVRGSAAVTLTRDRLQLRTVQPTAGRFAHPVAVQVQGASSFALENSYVFAGPGSVGGVPGAPIGLELLTVPAARVLYDAFLLDDAPVAGAITQAIAIDVGADGALVYGNLLFGTNGNQGLVKFASATSAHAIARLSNNAFRLRPNSATHGYLQYGDASGATFVTTLAGAEADLGGSVASGNVAVLPSASCAADVRCATGATCADAMACYRAAFGAAAAGSDYGFSTLSGAAAQNAGIPLDDSNVASCYARKRAFADVLPSSPSFVGAWRTPPPSLGPIDALTTGCP